MLPSAIALTPFSQSGPEGSRGVAALAAVYLVAGRDGRVRWAVTAVSRLDRRHISG